MQEYLISIDVGALYNVTMLENDPLTFGLKSLKLLLHFGAMTIKTNNIELLIFAIYFYVHHKSQSENGRWQDMCLFANDYRLHTSNNYETLIIDQLIHSFDSVFSLHLIPLSQFFQMQNSNASCICMYGLV